MTRSILRIFFILTLGLSGVASARAAFPTVALKAISIGAIQAPVNIANAGDGSGRLFICDQRGIIWVIQNGTLLPTPFLDLTAKVIPLQSFYDERGLLGLAFHPNYNKRDAGNLPLPGFGKFYVFYSAISPNGLPNVTPPVDNPVNCRTTISEFQVSGDPNVANPGSERIVLSFDKPQFNHNGGELVFGPDGFLYISVGDGGGANDNNYGHTGGRIVGGPSSPSGGLGNSQDKTRLLGKLLRIDPLGSDGPTGQYGIPPTNPFVTAVDGTLKEIYAYGLRNPWRASFDDGAGGTNRLFLADVGQNNVEEVNIITAGGNYGWRHREGTFDFDATSPVSGLPLIDPIAQYAHPGVVTAPPIVQLGRSITGGYLYRGSAIPALQGKYIFGDYDANAFQAGLPANAMVIGIEETSPDVWTAPALVPLVGGNPIVTHLLAMGRDEAGEIYLAVEGATGPQNDPTGQPTGGIYKIIPGTGVTTLTSIKDNSIYEEFVANSNGLGELYSGKNGGGKIRRALVSFDVSSTLSPGATINSAQLTLNLTNASSATPNNMALYRLSESWGEGTSIGTGVGGPATAGDTTWTQRFYSATTPVDWTVAGGTFVATSSANTVVTNVLGSFSWISGALAGDVQGWVDDPSTNFGWILRADETVPNMSAHVFSSRESGSGLRPQLQLTFTGVAGLSRREIWLQQYFSSAYFVSDKADPDGDGISNLMEYAFAFSPLVANPPGSGFQVATAPSGGNTIFTITFRRDPRATDLTYVLQTSSDLQTWTTIAQSVGGAVPTGSAQLISEVDAAGESPVKVVTVQQTLTPAQPKQFSRLQVSH